jgi:Ner family transcriptional regulator
MRPDWHPEDVKAEIRKTGVSMAQLSIGAGYCSAAVARCLGRPWPKVEALVAKHLKREPWDIWPSRYDAQHQPLTSLRRQPRRRKPSTSATTFQHRKTGVAR